MSSISINNYVDCRQVLCQINDELDKYKKSGGNQTPTLQGYRVILNNYEELSEAFFDRINGPGYQLGKLFSSDLERTGKRIDRLRKKVISISQAQRQAASAAAVAPQDPVAFFSQLTDAQIKEGIAEAASRFGITLFYDEKCAGMSPYLKGSGIFGNFYKGKEFEFGGQKTQYAEVIFQSEKFKDQPEIYKLFWAPGVDADKALSIARQNKMTSQKLKEWDGGLRDATMLNVLRAKFGQDEAAKAALLATKGCLIEWRPDDNRADRYWSTGLSGGENKLGIYLMQVRKEYGGAEVVEMPAEFKEVIETIQKAKKTSGAAPQNPAAAAAKPLCKRCKVMPVWEEKTSDGKTIIRVHPYCGITCAIAAGAKKPL